MYLAQSLDGYIARPDGDVSWLDRFSTEDYGYDEFFRGVEAVFVGAHTYEWLLEHDPHGYGATKTYVLTSRRLPAPKGADVELYSANPAELVARVRRTASRDLYLAGGGRLNASFLAAGLVDDIRVATVPVVLGAGIRPVEGPTPELVLRATEVRSWESGVVQVDYRVVRTAP